ncbi:MAG: DUF4261 domain-containing protein [Planctomycetia bacterium]|nr:DUF4261 domain-containing protein [Planctomycetia bacterium]
MDFLDRFAVPLPVRPASFQILFDDLSDLSADGLSAALRDYHPELAAATVEFVSAAAFPVDSIGLAPDGPPPAILGLAEWGEHSIRLVACDAPMPSNAVEACLKPALLPPEFKARARAHRAHILLYYAGRAADPLEQRVALGCVAGSLAHFGAIVTLNEEARAAIASFALTADDDDEDMLATLRTLPVPFLYGGFAKMELTGVPGVWIRTFAAPRIGLPNLAYHADGHADGERVFQLFGAMLGYLRETGVPLESGERIGVDDDRQLAVRAPDDREWWLDGDGPMWVLEDVRSAEFGVRSQE